MNERLKLLVIFVLDTVLCLARLPILRDSASKFQTLSDVLRHAISIHAKELAGAKALIDGKLVITYSLLFFLAFYFLVSSCCFIF